MPKRSRNRSSSLLNRPKRGRHIRAPLADPNNKTNLKNTTTNNSVISTSNTEENEYSNTKVVGNDTIPNLVDDDDDIDSAPGVPEDDILMKRNHLKSLTHSHRWSVYHLFRYKYEGMYPDEESKDLYTYWLADPCGWT